MYLPKTKKVHVPPHIKNARSMVRNSVVSLVGIVGCLVVGGIQLVTGRSRENPAAKHKTGKRVLILGGGTAGSSMAASLTQFDPNLRVTVLDGSRQHVFKGCVSLAAAGHRSYDLGSYGSNLLLSTPLWTVTREADLVVAAAASIRPETNTVVDTCGVSHEYDYLVLACGAERDLAAVKGVSPSDCDMHRLCVNPHAIRDTLCSSHSGNVIVARASGAGGAYTRPMDGNYLSTVNLVWRFLKDFGRLSSGLTTFYAVTDDATPCDALPAAYTEPIGRFWDSLGIQRRCGHKIEKVDPKNRTVTLRAPDGAKTTLPYRLLVLDPPLRAPAAIASGGLSHPSKFGFADVDEETLQHRKYANVFAVGDCAALTNPKSYGAVFAQVPVATHNLLHVASEDERWERAEARTAGTALHAAAVSGIRCGGLAVATDAAGAPATPVADDGTAAAAALALKKRQQSLADRSLLPARYNGYSSFHINMTIWKCMWPEVERGRVRVDNHIWDNATFEGWRGLLNGLYLQLSAYEVMYFYSFLRGWWYPPLWFRYPEFPNSIPAPSSADADARSEGGVAAHGRA